MTTFFLIESREAYPRVPRPLYPHPGPPSANNTDRGGRVQSPFHFERDNASISMPSVSTRIPPSFQMTFPMSCHGWLMFLWRRSLSQSIGTRILFSLIVNSALRHIEPDLLAPEEGHFLNESVQAFSFDPGGDGHVRPHRLNPPPVRRDQPAFFVDERQPTLPAGLVPVGQRQQMLIAREVIVHIERMGRDTQKGMGKTQDRVTHDCR